MKMKWFKRKKFDFLCVDMRCDRCGGNIYRNSHSGFDSLKLYCANSERLIRECNFKPKEVKIFEEKAKEFKDFFKLQEMKCSICHVKEARNDSDVCSAICWQRKNFPAFNKFYVETYLGEPKMKEFDLRPFVVRNPKETITKYFIEYEKKIDQEWDIFNGVGYDSQHTAAQVLADIFHDHYEACKGKDWRITRSEMDTCREWIFADIEVGWFFKCSDGDLYWKHENDEFRSLGSKCPYDKRNNEIEFSHFFVLGTNLDPDPDLKDLTITNVYNCPELAKVLMIERIIT